MTDQMDDESDVCDIWMSLMDDELTDDGRMDDGGHHLRDTQTHTHTDTDTDTDARTFFSRDLMVCRGRFTIGPFGAIKIYKTHWSDAHSSLDFIRS